jgi:hypothetical protein
MNLMKGKHSNLFELFYDYITLSWGTIIIISYIHVIA